MMRGNNLPRILFYRLVGSLLLSIGQKFIILRHA